MTYAQFRDHVLQLINQYTINGDIVDPTYNDQPDYIARIPALYNLAMSDVVSSGEPIIDVIDKDTVSSEISPDGEWVTFVPPEDFIKMKAVLMIDRWGRPYRANNYYRIGKKIKIRRDVWEEGELEYERTPASIDTDYNTCIDDVILDGEPNQIYAAAFYVAARLVMDGDAFVYSSLMNEYDDRCNKMHGLSAETVNNPDVYGLDQIYQ